jgi:hypothetical protein
MEKLIAGLTILATLGAVAVLAQDAGQTALRRIGYACFGLAMVGAAVLIASGIRDVLPKPVAPYPYLSLTCATGTWGLGFNDTYHYVILENSIPVGITMPYGTVQKDALYFATCLVRNDGPAVDAVKIAFKYFEPSPPMETPLKSGKLPRPLKGEKSAFVTIPYVGTRGAYLSFESDLPGLLIELVPTSDCSLEDPSIGHERRPCALPKTDQPPMFLASQLRD